MNKYIFIDAETDGLYGPFISVAMIVLDRNGNEESSFYGGIANPINFVNNQWVKENVLPIMGEYEHFSDENSLLCAVWNFWKRYTNNAYMIGDVIHPVESRLMTKCLQLFGENEFEGPFPMLDLASILYAKGIDPLIDRKQLLNTDKIDLKQHNPLDDVRITMKIWKNLIGV